MKKSDYEQIINSRRLDIKKIKSEAERDQKKYRHYKIMEFVICVPAALIIVLSIKYNYYPAECIGIALIFVLIAWYFKRIAEGIHRFGFSQLLKTCRQLNKDIGWAKRQLKRLYSYSM